jgi:hypothetical protein
VHDPFDALDEAAAQLCAPALWENAVFASIVEWGAFPLVAGVGAVKVGHSWLAGRASVIENP